MQQGDSLNVIGKIEHEAVTFLVDIGSAITVALNETFSRLRISEESLEGIPFDLCVADGQQLKVAGEMNMEIILGPTKAMHPVIVADIKVPAIIGMDFMTSFGCSLDLKKSLMKVRDIEINMWHESTGKPTTCKVSLCQDEIIPAPSECIVNIFMCKRGSEGQLNMIEGIKLLQQKYNILAARTLNDVNTSKTVVRLCNPTQENIRLKKDINVGICKPVTFCVTESTDNIDINQISLSEGKRQSIIQNSMTVPEHLKYFLSKV